MGTNNLIDLSHVNYVILVPICLFLFFSFFFRTSPHLSFLPKLWTNRCVATVGNNLLLLGIIIWFKSDRTRWLLCSKYFKQLIQENNFRCICTMYNGAVWERSMTQRASIRTLLTQIHWMVFDGFLPKRSNWGQVEQLTKLNFFFFPSWINSFIQKRTIIPNPVRTPHGHKNLGLKLTRLFHDASVQV